MDLNDKCIIIQINIFEANRRYTINYVKISNTQIVILEILISEKSKRKYSFKFQFSSGYIITKNFINFFHLI